MTLTLVYGGTFDPVHSGHLKVARQLLSLFEGSQISLVPCRHPVHRAQPTATAEDRMQMLQLAIARESSIAIDTCELERDGPSYAVDTLRHYRDRLGESAPLGFVMGMDSWQTLPTWHHWRQLRDYAHLIIVSRPGYPHTMKGELQDFAAGRITDKAEDLLTTAAGCIYFAELQESDVSATQLRQALGEGKTTAGLLPSGVAEYINTHQLYQTGGLARRDNG